jgi:hypothetical protein
MAALAKAGSVLPQPVRLRSRMARIDTLSGTSEERRTDNPADEVGRASASEAELARDIPAYHVLGLCYASRWKLQCGQLAMLVSASHPVTVCRHPEKREDMTLPITDHMTAATLGELSKIARDVIAMAEALWGIGQRRRDRRAAKNLYGIAFKPGGMLDLLQKISNDEATPEIIDALEQLLKSSEARVNLLLQDVKKYSDVFRERFGFDASIVLEGGLDGKNFLRRDIGRIITVYRRDELNFAYMAERAVQDVQILNSILSQAHDRILSYEAKNKRKDLTRTGTVKPKRRITKPVILLNAPDDSGNLPSGRRNRPPKKTA